MSKSRKSYSEMDAAELAEATREFDHEMPGLPGKPLSAAQRRAHRAAKVGRPVRGEGATVVAASIERGLLRKAEAYAKRQKLGRSAMFAEALKALLANDAATKAVGGNPTKRTEVRRAKAG